MSTHDAAPFRKIFAQCVRVGLTREFSTLEELLVAAGPLGLQPSVREFIEEQEIPRPAGTRYVLAVAPVHERAEVPSCTAFGGDRATGGRYLVFLMGLPNEFIDIFLEDWDAGVKAMNQYLGPLP